MPRATTMRRLNAPTNYTPCSTLANKTVSCLLRRVNERTHHQIRTRLLKPGDFIGAVGGDHNATSISQTSLCIWLDKNNLIDLKWT